jgi:hypothetical protein
MEPNPGPRTRSAPIPAVGGASQAHGDSAGTAAR